MKIFQVGKFPRERPGGIETAVFSLAKQLALRHQVEVAVSATGGVGKTFSWEGVACHQLPTWFSIFSTPVSPSLIGALRRASGFDVLQISYQNPMAALAYWIARPAGRLVIWYHHDIVRQVWLGRLLEPLLSHLLKKADAIVSTSRAYAGSSIILRKFADKVRVIPLGIELSPFEDDKEIRTSEIVRRRYGSPLILFIGRLVYYKGLDYLIEAMQGLKANLLVIGSGPLESRLRAGAQTRGVGPQVHFLEVPFALENISTYAKFQQDEMSEWEFYAGVAEKADIFMMLDVNNIYVSSRNQGFDPKDYYSQLPLDRVIQIHLAGHTDYDAYCLDTHDHPVCDEVWKIYAEVYPLTGPVSTLLEWDDRFIPFEETWKEALKAKAFQKELVKK